MLLTFEAEWGMSPALGQLVVAAPSACTVVEEDDAAGGGFSWLTAGLSWGASGLWISQLSAPPVHLR